MKSNPEENEAIKPIYAQRNSVWINSIAVIHSIMLHISVSPCRSLACPHVAHWHVPVSLLGSSAHDPGSQLSQNRRLD